MTSVLHETHYGAAILPIRIVCRGEDGTVRYDRLLAPAAEVFTGESAAGGDFRQASPVSVQVGDGIPFCILGAGPLGHEPVGGPHWTEAWDASGERLWSHRCITEGAPS